MMEIDPPVAQSLQQHQVEISSILEKIKHEDSGGTCIVDELFVLRFLLADALHAERNIRVTLDWRRRNRDILLQAASGNIPNEKEFSRHVKRGPCGWLGGQYLVFVVRAGLGDPVGIMRDLTPEQCVENMLFTNEYVFQLCDSQTRRTGKLCTMITIIDLQGFSMRRFDRRFSKANGDTSHLKNLYYPYLSKLVVLINLPSTFRILFSFGKVFMSRSILEKQKICPARTLNGGHPSASECPFLKRFGSDAAQAIPHFLGGTHPLPVALKVDDVNDDAMDQE